MSETTEIETPELMNKRVFSEHDFARRVLFGRSGIGDDQPFENNICRLTNHTEIRFEHRGQLGVSQSDWLTERDEKSNFQENGKEVFVAPDDINFSEFIRLIKAIEGKIPSRPETDSVLKKLSERMVRAAALTDYIESKVASHTFGKEEVKNKADSIIGYLKALSRSLEEFSQACNGRNLTKPLVDKETAKPLFKEFGLKEDIVEDRAQRLESVQDAKSREETVQAYTRFVTRAITSKLNQQLSGELQEKASLALAKKGAGNLLASLLPEEVYRRIRFPTLYSNGFITHKTPESLRNRWFDKQRQSPDRFIEELRDDIEELRPLCQLAYQFKDLYEGFGKERGFATADQLFNGKFDNLIAGYLERGIVEAELKNDEILAEKLQTELSDFQKNQKESVFGRFRTARGSLPDRFRIVMGNFRSKFGMFGYWPQMLDVKGSSPSFIAENAQMDCIGRAFTAYAFLKQLGIRDEDIVSVSTGIHTCLLVQSPDFFVEDKYDIVQGQFYLIDAYPMSGLDSDRSPWMEVVPLTFVGSGEYKTKEKFTEIFKDPVRATRRIGTLGELVDGLSRESKASLKDEKYQDKVIELNHGPKSVLTTMLYHEIRAMQILYQNQLEGRVESEERIRKEDIDYLITFLQRMSPGNPYYKELKPPD